MNIIDKISGQQVKSDLRMVFAKKIVKTYGKVEKINKLLINEVLQTGFCLDTCELCSSDTDNAGVLLDFGVELNGGIRFLVGEIYGEVPARIRITFGESVAEACSDIGEGNAGNDHSPRDFVVNVPKMCDLTFGQTGFRFVKIEVLSKNTTVCFRNIVAAFLYTPLDYLGYFNCDDELLNKIYKTAVYTAHLNVQNGMVWDGIKRDRLVWIGDLNPELKTICYNFGAIEELKNSLIYCKSSAVSGWINTIPSYSMWWIINLYDYYMFSGDYSFAAENFEYVLEILKMVENALSEGGCFEFEKVAPSELGYFLDWGSYQRQGFEGGVHALCLIALDCAEKLAHSLNRNINGLLCLRRRMTRGRLTDLKQVTAMQSLAGEVDRFIAGNKIATGGASGFSTFMSYYMLKALANSGLQLEALEIIKEYFGGMLSRGATTFWEDFDVDWLQGSGCVDEFLHTGQTDIHGNFGKHCYKGFRHSLCHGWASGVSAYLIEEIAGIKIVEAGFKKIIVKPNLCGLSRVAVSIATPSGVIKVDHIKKGEKIRTDISAPDNIKIIRQ